MFFESRRLFLNAGDWLKNSALIGGKLRLHFISKMAFKRGRRNQQRKESYALSVKFICISLPFELKSEEKCFKINE
jgi:hypothetical protein